MNDAKRASNLGRRLTFASALGIGIIALLAFSLAETRFIGVVSFIATIVWVVLAFFIAKYFYLMVKTWFK